MTQNQFYFLLNACHHIKSRKNLMNWLCEIFIFCIFGSNNVKETLLTFFNACHQESFQNALELLILGPKMTHSRIFEHISSS